MVECLPSKQGVAGSNPVSRSIFPNATSYVSVREIPRILISAEPSVDKTVSISE